MNIYDIATRAGVSIATVSRVINGSDRVSDDTREKILAVMDEMGYVPNGFARGLGLGTMKMIGLLCTDVADPYYAKAVSVLESALTEEGYDAILGCTGDTIEGKKRCIQRMLAKKVDALILVSSRFSETSDHPHIERAARQIPVVVVNGVIDAPNTYCVTCDEKSAMRENIALLYHSGRRQILYAYDVETYSSMQKLAGLRLGLQDMGLAPESLQLVKAEKGKGARPLISAALRQTREPFSAILASEDYLAADAMKAASACGLSIPGDVAVIGFNNSELCRYTTPELTSVDNRAEDLCLTAVKLLRDVFSGKQAPGKTVFSPFLIRRQTF